MSTSSGSVIPEMGDLRLVEYRNELIGYIADKYTAEVAVTTCYSDFMDLRDYCKDRLVQVTDEIVSRFEQRTLTATV